MYSVKAAIIRPETSPKTEQTQAKRGVRFSMVLLSSLSSNPEGKVRTATR